MKIYISGKISHLPFDAVQIKFAAAVDSLIKRFPTAKIINPLDINPSKDIAYKDAMIADLIELWDCTHIFMLSDWKDSRGARIEHFIAQELGLFVAYELT